jgi:uncharacterized protein (DUF433 family)
MNVRKDSKDGNLDRIVSYPDSPDGLAYIRNTGILVYDIAARLADTSYSPSDILREYPILEAEDIGQAMAYAFREVLHFNRVINYDLRAPLMGISLTAELVLMHEEDKLTSATNAHLRAILESIRTSMYLLNKFRFFQLASYTLTPNDPVQVKFQDFLGGIDARTQRINSVQSGLPQEVSIPEELPPVSAHDLLFGALLALFDGSVLYEPHGKVTLNVTQISPMLVEVTVTHEASISTIGTKHVPWLLDHPLAAVARVIQLSGSELKITPAADHVKFTFQLPVWSENESV